MAYATVPPFGAERKHAQVHLRWLHEQLCGGEESPLRKVESRENVADIFTKPLPLADFARHRSRLGVMPRPAALGAVTTPPEQIETAEDVTELVTRSEPATALDPKVRDLPMATTTTHALLVRASGVQRYTGDATQPNGTA